MRKKKKISLVLLLLTAIALVGIPQVMALPSFLNAFNGKYGTAGTRLDTCDTCHIPGLPQNAVNLNPYGKNVQSNLSLGIDQALTNAEVNDSDGDGFINIVEIHNLTFPGNASDFPPVITSFSPPSPVNDTAPATRTFSIIVNQVVSVVTWFLDGIAHKTDNSVNSSSDTIIINSSGLHNVTAVAQKAGDGTAAQTWEWNVSSPTPTPPTPTPTPPTPTPTPPTPTPTPVVIIKASGGGWIVSPVKPSKNNDRATFGFVASNDTSAVTGNIQYNDHAAGLRMSGNVTALIVDKTTKTATFSGTATITNATMTLNGTYTATAVDNGEPGRGDTFTISIPAVSYAANGTLGGGNIQVDP